MVGLAWVPILIIVALIMANSAGSRAAGRVSLVSLLVLWHTFFCMVYLWYASNNVADANGYYNQAVLGNLNWVPGTGFIVSITTTVVQLFGLNKISAFLFYNLMGVAGILLLYRMLSRIWPCFDPRRRPWVPTLIAFLPGLSFWTSAIGKDAPAFLSVCLACYATLDIQRRKFIMTIAIIIMLLVRPHVAVVMVMSLAGALALSGREISGFQRFLTLAGAGLVVAIVLPIGLRYVGIEGTVSAEAILNNIEMRQSYNSEGGSSIDIQSMSFPVKLLTYLLRPLFFDASGIMSLIVSVENLFLIYLIVRFSPTAIAYVFKNSSVAGRYNAIFSLILWIVLASTTANLGIAVRQKTMILPSLFVWIALSVNWAACRRAPKLPNGLSFGRQRHGMAGAHNYPVGPR